MPHVNCPKPGCGWSVDPATVPAGKVIACPECGQRFKLATAAPSRGSSGTGVTLAVWAGAGLLAVFVVGAVWGALFKFGRKPVGNPLAASADIRSETHNFAFSPPSGDWAADPDLRTALGVNVTALHRTAAPEAWAAVAVKDYGDRAPLESELRGQMVATLGRVFLNLPAEPPLEPTTWAGRPAVVWRFRGEHQTTGTVCGGEAFALTHKGVGYWFLGWAAERDYDPADLQRVRDGFRLLGGRTDWKPTAGNGVLFRSPAGGWRLTAYEKVWELVSTPDDGVELELRGVLKGRGRRDFPPRAEVRVWRRADAGDPAAVADALVRKEFTRDPAVFGPTEFAELADPPAGDAPPGPDAPSATPVKRLKVTGGSNEAGRTRKLVAVAAVRVGGDVVVAVGSCPWDEREAWERRLVQLVGSLGS